MPWIVEEGHCCPPGRPFAVINKSSGKREGCHPSKEAATQQQKALYANAPKENSMNASPSRVERRASQLRALAQHLERVGKRSDLRTKFRQLAGQLEQDGDWDDDPGHLAQAVDASLDQALEAFQDGETDQGVALVVAAAASADALLAALNLPDADEVGQDPMGGLNSAVQPGEAIRDMAFEMVPHSDGLTLEGYAAVFNSPTRIQDLAGEFDETIAPGAFARTLRERPPVLMFEHGRHPLIGSMPLGVIKRAAEDSKGVHIEARLSDNWLIQPVRDAVRDGAVTGMSFRFTVPQGGDSWNKQKTVRTLTDVDVRELGPVVFPAYEPTTASVRSALDSLPILTGRPDARSAGGGESPDAQPGKGEASPPQPLSIEQARRDRELRIRGIIRV